MTSLNYSHLNIKLSLFPHVFLCCLMTRFYHLNNPTFFSPFFFIAQYPVLTGLTSSEKSIKYKSSRSQMFFKTAVLKNLAIFPGKHLCWSLFLIKLQPCNFIKKETPTKAVSSEYCEIFKNCFFIE